MSNPTYGNTTEEMNLGVSSCTRNSNKSAFGRRIAASSISLTTTTQCCQRPVSDGSPTLIDSSMTLIDLVGQSRKVWESHLIRWFDGTPKVIAPGQSKHGACSTRRLLYMAALRVPSDLSASSTRPWALQLQAHGLVFRREHLRCVGRRLNLNNPTTIFAPSRSCSPPPSILCRPRPLTISTNHLLSLVAARHHPGVKTFQRHICK
ncbi:hypothetical protein B0H14DRAFT_3616233 [Mycena olivaceomarginata]|nr:hypothetical protein B0H14DRAFT_3616233 [Mycena olivaceomarginata]